VFGLSFGKLLVMAAVIAFVWFGWRKLAEVGKALQNRASAPPPAPGGGASRPEEPIDLVRDPETGRYEPRKPD